MTIIKFVIYQSINKSINSQEDISSLGIVGGSVSSIGEIVGGIVSAIATESTGESDEPDQARSTVSHEVPCPSR